jgi:radical SAM superfamily enzyme YgiQ (UPF0313 family)
MPERVLLVKIDKPAGGPQRLSFSEPIGLCYISAYLKQHGVACRVLHLTIEGPSVSHELTRVLTSYSPTIVGFSVRNFNFNISMEYAHVIRCRLPEARIFIGGECITSSNAAELLRSTPCDLAVVSDGEEAVLKYATGVPPAQIPGVAFRDEQGVCTASASLPVRVKPADLPMMDRTDLPMARYSSEAFPNMVYATMHAQRGCRYECTFCHTATRYSGAARCLSRTPRQVLEEIDYLSVHYGVEAVSIWDEDFFADLSRVEQIARGLVNKGSPVAWQTFMKLTDLTRPQLHRLLPLLQRSRYARAVIGFESFIPKTLRLYHKAGGPFYDESLKRLSDAGVHICPSYIIGEPHEAYEDLQFGLKRLLMLRDAGIHMDLPYICFLTPFPGTPLYEQYQQEGLILDQNWDHYDGEHVVVRPKPPCSPEDLVALRDSFYREFYGGEG